MEWEWELDRIRLYHLQQALSFTPESGEKGCPQETDVQTAQD
jgi:hypothetical protein